ncbi:MAG: hypothetical protein JNIBNLAF_01527 [Nitrosomonas europaea]|nr:hypothetical protein [Nitrosomonas europaea]
MIAAKSDTSINALFNAELRHLVETFEAAEAGGNQNFKTLLDFSLGRITDHQALVALGIDSQEDLFLLMAQAHLPMPRLPDAGPLITLAYADSLDLLFKPGWSVALVDIVLHEVTRNPTPTNKTLVHWVENRRIPVLPTKIFQRYQQNLDTNAVSPRKVNLGELAIQETMNDFALVQPPKAGVFLFEDHKIARASFLLPDNCRKVSTRAFLLFLEQKGWLVLATAIERKAIQAGRAFSSLRFP